MSSVLVLQLIVHGYACVYVCVCVRVMPGHMEAYL